MFRIFPFGLRMDGCTFDLTLPEIYDSNLDALLYYVHGRPGCDVVERVGKIKRILPPL